jgi:hypothetical protein
MTPGADLVIHHTARTFTSTRLADEKARVRQTQEFHMRPESQKGRGFADIAYNELVAPSGRIYTGRGPGVKGGHLLDPLNADWYGICFIGQYDESPSSIREGGPAQPPTSQALAVARELVALRVAEGVIKQDFELKGHRDFQLKACPGNLILGRFRELRPGGEDVLTPEEQDKLDRADKLVQMLLEKIGLKTDPTQPATIDGATSRIAQAVHKTER